MINEILNKQKTQSEKSLEALKKILLPYAQVKSIHIS